MIVLTFPRFSFPLFAILNEFPVNRAGLIPFQKFFISDQLKGVINCTVCNNLLFSLHTAFRDTLIFFNPKDRVLQHFIYRTKGVTGYLGLRVNSAFPFLLCTSLRDDRQSFLHIFNFGNQRFRLDLWVNILQSLMKSSPFFCLTDVAGPAVFATNQKFSFRHPSQQQTSTWRKYGNWSHSSATPKTPQTHPPSSLASTCTTGLLGPTLSSTLLTSQMGWAHSLNRNPTN